MENPVDAELKIIADLIGDNHYEVKLNNMGANSRVYVINGGSIVFKFPRSVEVSYENETNILKIIGNLDTDVALQRVGWQSQDDKYLGLFGVMGEAIQHKNLTPQHAKLIGEKVGCFLRKLHGLRVNGTLSLHVSDEIKAWQERYHNHKVFIDSQLSVAMQKQLYEFMTVDMPGALNKLGEDLAFSHGDLGDNNILIDDGAVGIIDFNESSYLDRAADFMDIHSAEIVGYMLDAYGASNTLRSKVALRRKVSPVIALHFYIQKNDEPGMMAMIDQIKVSFS